MQQQNYSNHRKMDPPYHYVLSFLCLLILIGSIWFLIASGKVFEGLLFLAIALALLILFLKVRGYGLRAQDRAIRAEENLRHFILTGMPHDSRLTIGQIIALRFASDKEFPQLSRKAAENNMKPDDIKKAINSWRADHNRL
ncbi:DUF6526 family protein [Paenibacillus radicis (ex Xue et al. 2023)]|uniref:DUF6526 family protein n=1 Tax=Paenibacillus radicis (ex Xue et al. 2023) TaxID=2972489 RepID=A0ABT1YRK6_9BACL|nr:DUF6526 family protein [Paenibacillus radicis (ex Xue et al. 2023)]MCR8634620.1 DUF6526 family protein [Paenibacillus radicis (ex Xue et al. 2023)]